MLFSGETSHPPTQPGKWHVFGMVWHNSKDFKVLVVWNAEKLLDWVFISSRVPHSSPAGLCLCGHLTLMYSPLLPTPCAYFLEISTEGESSSREFSPSSSYPCTWSVRSPSVPFHCVPSPSQIMSSSLQSLCSSGEREKEVTSFEICYLFHARPCLMFCRLPVILWDG